MDKQVRLVPRLSEKAYNLSETRNTYTFDVPLGSNKHTVARAVAAQFDVTVTSVRIVNVAGKSKRTVSQKGKMVKNGRTVALKKAYISLKEGDSLPLFKGIKEAEAKQEATQEKFTKAIEKQSKKSKKEAAKDTGTSRRGFRRFVNRRGEA
jgi:large subunit ribosomal protein L23